MLGVMLYFYCFFFNVGFYNQFIYWNENVLLKLPYQGTRKKDTVSDQVIES